MFPPEIIKRLSRCQKVFVLTGAGISAESGIATFRGQGGQWDQVDPMKMATPEAFTQDPKAVWEWYEARRRQVAGAEPNRGHDVIVWMESYFPQCTLATQNVDRLHQKAGSRNPLELHGSLWMVRCTGFLPQPSQKSGKEVGTTQLPNIGIDLSGRTGCGEWEDRHELTNLPPKCPHCGALARPGVVWFGENLPPELWAQAEKAAGDCDAFFVIGTSALVHPAAALPEAALRKGTLVLEINPEETPLSSRATLSIRSKAGEALESLAEGLSKNLIG